MRTSTKIGILALVFSSTSCRPSTEEISRTMVAATAEFESAVTVALQQIQTSTTIVRNTGSTVTPLDLTEHTPTLVPTDPPNVTKTKEPTGAAGPSATVTPSATTASTNTRDAIDTLTAIAAIQVPESDLREIAMRLHGHADIPATVSSQPASHQHGDVIEFSATNLDTDEQFSLTAELVYASPLVLFFVEPQLQVNLVALQPFLEEFEQLIVPTVREFFGHEWSPGIDGDPRLYILYAAGLGRSVAGYFSSTDEYSRLAHQYSNEKEMFYLNADVIALDDPGLPGLLAHEFQHMVHWANDSNEEAWMNEGASVLSELLTGNTPWGFDRAFASNPDLQLNAWCATGSGPECVPHYGAAFLFLEYFLERFGETATRALMAHPANGLAAMDVVLQELGTVDTLSGKPINADRFFADWVVANYLGDTSWADGRYGYRDYTAAPRTARTDSLACTTRSGELTVHQYAADYITVDCPSTTRTRFIGNEQVRAVPAEPHSGDFMFWGNRQDSSDTTLTREFDLSQVSAATLKYWAWWSLEENYDYVYLVVSNDGGESWKIMETPRGTHENPTGNNLGWGYHYNSGGEAKPKWVQESVDLSAFAGEHILIRFEYLTDASVNWPGILVDDISVPEIDYSEDFEVGKGGWESGGWVRFDNSLRQRWLIQVIEPDTRSVRRVDTSDGSADFNLAEGDTLVVSAITPYTTEIAHYRLEFNPD